MADDGIIRSVGGLYAEVTVTESHMDELTITSHPVERGAAITDHAFKNPAQLSIKLGWSAAYASSSDSGSGGDSTDAGSGQGINDIYEQLLEMQSSAQPLEVQTGKRLYEDMLIKSIKADTDQMTENVLLITMMLQQIILVDTLQTTMPPASSRSDHAASAGVTSTGANTLQSAAPSQTSNDPNNINYWNVPAK
jgi:hypothetical protein